MNGILADNVPDQTEYRGVKVIGDTEKLASILQENQMDEIVITLGLSEYSKLAHIVNMCEKSGVHTKFVPDYNNVIPTKPYTEDILGMPVINIRHVPLNSNVLNALQNVQLYFWCGSGNYSVFIRVMLVTAIIIKATSPGALILNRRE